jgi:2-keto-4-pentenoate hydratase
MLTDNQRDEVVTALLTTWSSGVPRPALASELRPGDLEEAYAVQDHLVARLGRPLIGWKVGASDVRAQASMGLGEPFSGRLLGGRIETSPAEIDVSSLPGGAASVECELGVRVGTALRHEDAPFTAKAVRACVATVAPCFELPGARFENNADAGWMSVIADDGGAFGAVVGRDTSLDAAGSLAELTVVFSVNGDRVAEGAGVAALGDPLESLRWLANHLAARKLTIEAGSLVLTGALTGGMHRLAPGDRAVTDFGPLGAVEATFS